MRQAIRALSMVLAVGCGGSDGHRLGVEGASCLKTADCEDPLQCLKNVCTNAFSGPDAKDAGPDLQALDHAYPLDSDAWSQEGPADPSQEGAPDPGTDPGPDVPDYGQFPDVEIDLGPDPTVGPPDVPVVVPDAYGECENLGISPSWTGLFEGKVTYDLKGKGGTFGVPDKDVLDVSGTLGFEIKCLEKKLAVVGSLDGIATSPTQIGSNPFAIKIGGSYNTKTKTITASLIEGEVKLWGLVGVYFEGKLSGSLQGDGDFTGTWDGVETGNQLNWDVDASGSGTWEAGGS